MLRLVRSRRFLRAADLGHPWPQHNPLLAELGQTLVLGPPHHHPTIPNLPTRHTPRRISHVHKSPLPFPAIWRRLKPASLSHAGPLPAGGAQWRQVRVKLWFLWKVGTRRVQDVGRSRKVGARPSCSCDIRRPGDTTTNQLSPTIDTFRLTFPSLNVPRQKKSLKLAEEEKGSGNHEIQLLVFSVHQATFLWKNKHTNYFSLFFLPVIWAHRKLIQRSSRKKEKPDYVLTSFMGEPIKKTGCISPGWLTCPHKNMLPSILWKQRNSK